MNKIVNSSPTSLKKMYGWATPFVLEKDKLNVVSVDVFSRLLSERIIFLSGEIDDDIADVIVASLLYLDSLNDDPIKIYINSPGGSVTAGLMIYDTMSLVKSPIHTLCMGLAASMASILLAAGDEREILPNGQVMIHQPMGGAWGQEADIQIAAEQLTKCRQTLVKILSKHTGKSYDEINNAVDRDNWFDAQEAVEYGLVDKIK